MSKDSMKKYIRDNTDINVFRLAEMDKDEVERIYTRLKDIEVGILDNPTWYHGLHMQAWRRITQALFDRYGIHRVNFNQHKDASIFG